MRAITSVLVLFIILIVPKNDTAINVTVTKIVDGDTIRIDPMVNGTDKVRLLSIDSPETNFNGKSQPWGTEATQELQRLIPLNSTVSLILDNQGRDIYGRVLAYIEKDGIDINLELIKRGAAVTYIIWPNVARMAEYQAAQYTAIQQGIGMWTSPDIELPFVFRKKISKSRFSKFVGDIDKRTLLSPTEYSKVPISDRLFFLSVKDGTKAGFK